MLTALAQTWENFLKNTDIAGASNAGRAKFGGRRYFWTFVFLAGVTFTFYGVGIFFSTYFGFPVTTTVSLDSREYVSLVFTCGVTARSMNAAFLLLPSKFSFGLGTLSGNQPQPFTVPQSKVSIVHSCAHAQAAPCMTLAIEPI